MPIGEMLGGLAQAGGQVYAANKASKAASDSLNYQKQIRSDVQPYTNAGASAVQTLSDPNKLMSNFTTDPSYQWNMQQGLNAVGTDKAVNGLLKSGGAIKSLAGYASGLAGNQFNSYVNRLQDTAKLGIAGEDAASGAANQMTNVAMQNGANQGNVGLDMGNTFSKMFGGLYQQYGPQNTGGGGSNTGATSYGG